MRAGARPWVIKSDGRVSRGRHPAIGEGGGYLLFRFRSTIGVAGFNFSVRNGKRWSPRAITTLVLSQSGCWRLWRLVAAVFAVPAVEGGKKGVWKPGAGLSDRLATCFSLAEEVSVLRHTFSWERVWVISIARL